MAVALVHCDIAPSPAGLFRLGRTVRPLSLSRLRVHLHAAPLHCRKTPAKHREEEINRDICRVYWRDVLLYEKSGEDNCAISLVIWRNSSVQCDRVEACRDKWRGYINLKLYLAPMEKERRDSEPAQRAVALVQCGVMLVQCAALPVHCAGVPVQWHAVPVACDKALVLCAAESRSSPTQSACCDTSASRKLHRGLPDWSRQL